MPQAPQPGEHRVLPLELFFDLVFAFAFTQVTGLILANPTWLGILHGMLVLAALWWAWNVYAWLSSAMDVDQGEAPACCFTQRRHHGTAGQRNHHRHRCV